MNIDLNLQNVKVSLLMRSCQNTTDVLTRGKLHGSLGTTIPSNEILHIKTLMTCHLCSSSLILISFVKL